VALSLGGGGVVAWMQDLGQGQGWDVFARQIAPGGTPIGSQFKVDSSTSANQVSPAVGSNAAGDFAVAWESGPTSNKSIFGRFFNPDGSAVGPEFEVAATEGGWCRCGPR
jgi:hypothetical protein